jgi:nucleotide-binding universal stress UspA family protein
MKSVLIAIDGSDLDRTVLRCAHGLFGDKARYLIVNVHNEPLVYSTIALAHGMASVISAPELLRFVEDDGSNSHNAAELARRAADAAGIADCEVDVESGDPAVAILTAARHHDVDVIAVGSHSSNWFERLFTPSVSKQLVDRARRPVLVVHTNDQEPTHEPGQEADQSR